MSVYEKVAHGWTDPSEWEMAFLGGEELLHMPCQDYKKSTIDVESGKRESLVVVRFHEEFWAS